MRRIKVPIFGNGTVPLGRRADVLAALKLTPDDAARCAWKDAGAPGSLGDDAFLMRAPSRSFLARAIRQQERGSNRWTLRPIVPLTTTEGY